MIRANAKGQSGSVTVEFALAAPLVCLVILAILQTGLVVSTKLLVAQAAREGARQATTADSDSEIIVAARAASGGLSGESLAVDWRAPEGWQAGSPVTVSARGAAPCIFPALSQILPEALSVYSESTMRLEKDR